MNVAWVRFSIKVGIPIPFPLQVNVGMTAPGMKSVNEGAHSILKRHSEISLTAAGTENMSAPFVLHGTPSPASYGDKKPWTITTGDTCGTLYNTITWAPPGENINDIWHFTRREQDEFAAASQQKTEAAQFFAGRFDDEIVLR